MYPDKRRYKIEYSDEFMDLTTKLLCKDKRDRLGTKGDWQEILDHPWFASLDREELYNQTMKPIINVDLGTDDGSLVNSKYFNVK